MIYIMSPLYQLRVDVHGRHVVHDDAEPHTLLVLEHVLQERRLAGAQEALISLYIYSYIHIYT